MKSDKLEKIKWRKKMLQRNGEPYASRLILLPSGEGPCDYCDRGMKWNRLKKRKCTEWNRQIFVRNGTDCTEAAKALRQGAATGRVALKAAAAPPVDSGVLSCAIDGALESSVAADMAALVGELYLFFSSMLL
jgi:hypothetical protein